MGSKSIIHLQRTEGSHFVAENEAGHKIELSGDGTAVGPMESLLAAAAGCSTIDILMILEKQKLQIDDIKVKVEGERREEIPRVYTSINMHYIVSGPDLSEAKVKRAIDLSLEKYCSVSIMLGASAEITSSFELAV